jgi:hypothetical protein
MAEDSSSHRLRWLVLALLLGGTVWYLRSPRQAGEEPVDVESRPDFPPPDLPPVCGTAQLAIDRLNEAEPEAPAASRPSPRPRRSASATLPVGSVAALPDGAAPGPEFTVKAKAGSELFHGPDSPYFGRTKADLWFRTADDARAAGLTAWTPRRRTAG